MELQYKPDFEPARNRWRAFWAHEIIDRPVCVVTTPKAGMTQTPPPPTFAVWDCTASKLVEHYAAYAESTFFGGEAIPFLWPYYGPEVFGAWLGADLIRNPNSMQATNWSVPFVEDWAQALPLKIDPQGEWWQKSLKAYRETAELADGRFLIGMDDLHSNCDALAAIRDPQALCMDFLLQPQLIHQAMAQVRALYPPVYNALFEACNGPKWGTIGWAPFYCEGKFAMTQCDLAIMISPKIFNEYVLPALEEEWAFLDHTIYHYDGYGALAHLDAILANPDLDGIQWVPGAGADPFIEWMDLLKQMQAAGKSLQIFGTPEEIKVFHKQLRPELCAYFTDCATEAEAEALLKWLVDNT